ncbi:MAG: adenosylcobinamide-GDP ribazoletransferase [Rhodospirillaceae bacterium]
MARRLFSGWPGDIVVAGGFLTRLPFHHAAGAGLGDLAAAARAFPLIGLGIGAVGGLALWLAAATALGPLASSLIGLAVMAWLTGALHEDGLADVADAMGGSSRERRLAIMRDSRIGSFGVLALVFAVAVKAAALSGFSGPGTAWAAMAAAAALSRAVMVPCMAWLRPARADGLGHGAGRPDNLTALQALGLGAVAAVALLGFGAGLAALAAALLAAAVLARVASARFGGYTGDVLGAVQQLAEAFVLIAVGGLMP